MKKPEISYRVMKTNEFVFGEPCVYYKVACSCGCGEHDMTLEIEHDWDMVTISLDQEMSWSSYWGVNNIFQRIWYRITGAWKMLFTGHIDVTGSVIFQGEEHIQGFLDAVEEGKDFVIQHVKDHEKEKEKEKKLNEKV